MTLFLTTVLSLTSAADAQSFPWEPPTICDTNPEACDFQLYPDLTVAEITTGCTGSGGDPTVLVKVANDDLLGATTYVDIWFGFQAIPSMGDYGDSYQRITVSGGATKLVTFTFPGQDNVGGYLDVIVDTDQAVAESNESNNQDYDYLVLPDCSFN